ncbi:MULTISPECIES: hypothetical protein [Pseudonocardia]|uniref:Uncharacterized protein n=2 Tax=Pseudonocardia TaxID=1847 RepID=A0A1Y2MXF9_PSEAH|nr:MULTISPECIES: hypothetical protein [Pseudonocardia]OSY39894.1 hypothetical protein BG845_03129 [Pseudonocardia autotrophica]TDN74490.1 hypothetical protein C8E95_3613 [Pseudonocardia autotrophica]BBG05257.1 membrane protein [Pseudonocardia autotrophica]GEC25735.1 membrane protein [Pseudonocardia saturnea]
MTRTVDRRVAAPPRRLARRPRAALRIAHVVLAIGWTGLAAVMLVLPAAVLLQGSDAGFAIPTMALVGGGVIPFFAVGTVLTGAALGIGTPWGLFRYRWVVVKTVLALAVIAGSVTLNSGWIDAAATDPSLLWPLLLSSVLHQVMLVSASVLSVEKPWGRLRRG